MAFLSLPRTRPPPARGSCYDASVYTILSISPQFLLRRICVDNPLHLTAEEGGFDIEQRESRTLTTTTLGGPANNTPSLSPYPSSCATSLRQISGCSWVPSLAPPFQSPYACTIVLIHFNSASSVLRFHNYFVAELIYNHACANFIIG